MRDVYQEQLTGLADALADMCLQTAVAMEDATRALLEADLQLAEQVIADDVRIDDLRVAAEEKAFGLLALQAPVATDLRVVISAIHGAGDIERMGDLAVHVAKVVKLGKTVPDEVRDDIAEMGRVAVELALKAADVVRSRNVIKAVELDADDDAMDRLHEHMFEVLMHPEWPHGVPAAVDLTLLARYYERFADHAVVVARGTVYAVTGEEPEAIPI